LEDTLLIVIVQKLL